MTQSRLAFVFICATVLSNPGAVSAQDAQPTTMSEQSNDEPVSLNGETQPADTEINTDNMAEQLNAQQELQQSFTFRRTINGEVVETDRRTVTYDRNIPSRASEAGQSTLDRLRSRFDAEVLTRLEAFEESKLDFTIADSNRDNLMSIDEFSNLVASWNEVDSRSIDATTVEQERQQQYDAFIAEISPETAKMRSDKVAKEKFLFLTGGMDSVSRQDYIREYLLDFDAMDTNKDTILRGDELRKFRALNRGESFETQD